MFNYQELKKRLPGYLQQENILKLMSVMGQMFDEFDVFLESKQNIHIIDLASGSYLDVIGSNIGVTRPNGMSDEHYKRRLKYFYYTIYFVPTLPNFENLIYEILGEYPTNVKEGYIYSGESGFLELDLIYPVDEQEAFLDDLDTKYGAGCRLKWHKFKRVSAVYETTGNDNSTYLTDLYDEKGIEIIPFDGLTYNRLESVGDDNSTGELEELDVFTLSNLGG